METFAQLPLNPALLRAIQELGYEKPTPIQAQTLPILLAGETDFIGLAATGTGKTAAFALPLLQRLEPDVRGVQAIILVPTRELSLQVAGQVNLLGKHLGIRALPIYGGAGYGEQLRGLKEGVSVVVGTPGRVIDHLERRTLKLNEVRVVVLDEADEMISMGFREDMETILQNATREHRNIWLFSATMSGAVRKVADQFLTNAQTVQVNRTEMLSATVEQYYYMVQEQHRPEVLCKLIDAAEDFFGLVFCQTKSLVEDLTRFLAGRGYRVDCLHGDMTQAARETTMDAFRRRQVKILVCTDVASRGLDVKDITHVVNFSIPRELDSYVHRIGRTARSGKTGMAMSLVTPSHRHLLGKIEQLTKSRFHEGQIPTRRAIATKKVAQLLGQFQDTALYPRALELMDDAWKQAVSTMPPEEVAARLIALLHPGLFAAEERAPVSMRSEEPHGAPPRHGAAHFKKDHRPERRDDSRKPAPEYPKQFTRKFHHGKKPAPGGQTYPARKTY